MWMGARSDLEARSFVLSRWSSGRSRFGSVPVRTTGREVWTRCRGTGAILGGTDEVLLGVRERVWGVRTRCSWGAGAILGGRYEPAR